MYLASVLLLLSFSLYSCQNNNATTATLKALHIVFRHGHRTSEEMSLEVYPNDPHKNEKYYPFGAGQLTNQGKKRAYVLGQWLRKRYNAFLGNIYHPNNLEAVSSGYNRTAATLALVLAGMYPPKGTDLEWNEDLNWQPVLYKQLSQKDNYLGFPILLCSKYRELLKKYMKSSEGKKRIELSKSLREYLIKYSGSNVAQPLLPLYFFDLFSTQQEWGLTIPDWAKPIYPNILRSAAVEIFDMLSATTELQRYTIGYLLEKIVKESALKIANKTEPPEKNLFIYSAHDFNLIALQKMLGMDILTRPTYAACIMIEVHKINNVSGIKVYYDTESEGDPQPITLPGCEHFCPFKKFFKLVKEYLPTKDMSCEVNETDNLKSYE